MCRPAQVIIDDDPLSEFGRGLANHQLMPSFAVFRQQLAKHVQSPLPCCAGKRRLRSVPHVVYRKDALPGPMGRAFIWQLRF